MKYLAIVYCLDPCGTNQSFSLSRETDFTKVEDIYPFMRAEAKATDDAIDTILLLESGTWEHAAPSVVEHWTAGNGDFEGL
jgi:hypothetical protein